MKNLYITSPWVRWASIAIMVLFVVLAATTYFNGRQIERGTELITLDAVPGTIQAHKMRMAMSRSIGWVMVAASAQTTHSRDESLQIVHDADLIFADAVKQYETTININPSDDWMLLNRVTSNYAEYSRQRVLYEELILAGDSKGSAAFLEYNLVPAYVAAITSAEELLKYNHSNISKYTEYTNDSIHQLYWAVVVVIVLALICSVVLLINLSIRRKELMELQESEELFRTSFENATVGVCLIAMDGRFINVNRTWCEMLGYSREELLQLTFHDVTHKEDLDIGRNFISLALSDGPKSLRTEKRYLRKDGQVVWAYLSTTIVAKLGGKKDYMISHIQDITERKRAEETLRKSNADLAEALEALQRTQQQIVQQENLRALGQMASGIAHDFNNALSPIIGYSDLLLQTPDLLEDKAQVIEFLEIINSAGQDAANVVSRMLEFSRHREVGEDFQNIDLNKLIPQSISLTQPKWRGQAQSEGRSISVESHLVPVPSIVGEESELREMLTNLIFNATDAMPVGGTITLSTAVDGNSVLLRVSDTGTGMTDEIRQRCLEPFFTTKGEKGTGLGLSMVYGIVQRHSGTIDISSQLGAGTTFTIQFPIQTISDKPEFLVAEKLSKSLHILVVDDQPGLCAVTTVLLENDGHTVETARDGEEALLHFKVGHFDLVMTDQAMPKMNGEQLASALQAIQPSVPVILMSGFAEMMKASGKIPPHTSVILSKPFTQSMLREALNTAVEVLKSKVEQRS